MKCYVGIDLGSTTTKAVVLDEEGVVRGRGITNSRANYDVACEVARAEAMLDARFQLLAGALERLVLPSGEREALASALRRNFRLEQYLHQLGELEATCRVNGEQSARERSPRFDDEVSDAFDELFDGLRREALELHRGDARPRSDFFRDLAGSAYAAQAESVAKRGDVEYDFLLGIYDKSILSVESRAPATFLQEMLGSALQRSLAEHPVAASFAHELGRDVERVIDAPLTEASVVGTGYGRARLPFPKENIRSEILCHGLGAHATFPGTRTVLDIGGQDTKAIQIDERGIVTAFQMNDRCAAGCGRYLGYIADEMGIGLHELGPLALQGRRPVRISSTCTVFAGAELRDRLAMGQRREDILAGLHRAIVLRAMSLLGRSGGVHEEFSFTGGVARNEAAVAALRQLVEENYGPRTMHVGADSIYMGALGAALFALRTARGERIPEPAAACAAGGVS